MISIDSPGTSAAAAAAPPAADGLGPSVDSDLADVERDLSQWFDSASGWLDQHPLASHLIGLLVLFAAAATVMLLVRLVLGPILKRVVDRYGHAALPHLINHRTIAAAGWVVAALVVWGLGPNLDWISEGARRLVVNIAGAVFALLAARLGSALLGGGFEYYQSSQNAQQRSITSFVQLAQLLVWIVGGIFAVSLLIDRSPALLLSGLGAAAAIILLIFRDTILSLVAAVQVSSYDLVRVGDWITAPKFGADGDVVEIGLNVVKVQNFDKTITSIPTYKLVDDSFTNWRGMTDSGARRIKRSLLIDLQSVRFLDTAEIDRFGRMAVLAEYIEDKRRDLAKTNQAADGTAAAIASKMGVASVDPSLRRLTNLGTFRAYAERYLVAREDIREDMTLMVRQLAATEDGVPIELYCFTNTTNWVAYEGIQSDIFDHLIAMTDAFDLRLVQNFDYDISSLGPRAGAAAPAASGSAPASGS